jgi:hypothetical protein
VNNGQQLFCSSQHGSAPTYPDICHQISATSDVLHLADRCTAQQGQAPPTCLLSLSTSLSLALSEPSS